MWRLPTSSSTRAPGQEAVFRSSLARFGLRRASYARVAFSAREHLVVANRCILSTRTALTPLVFSSRFEWLCPPTSCTELFTPGLTRRSTGPPPAAGELYVRRHTAPIPRCIAKQLTRETHRCLKATRTQCAEVYRSWKTKSFKPVSTRAR